MNNDQLEFHNVEELQPVPGCHGWKLQRFPEHVRNQLGDKGHTRGRFYAQRASGCEIRFVTPAKFFALTLSTQEVDTAVFVYRGDFLHSRHDLKAGVPARLFIEIPPMFSQVKPGMLEGGRFSPEVWRIVFHQDARAVYHGLDTYGQPVRPPSAAEKPRLRWLAYGSSITFGGNALLPGSSYVQHAARRLGVDVLNKGLPGSCLCEEVISDYLSACGPWDFATLELGVNMVELFTPAEFEQSARQLIQALHARQPERMIFVINLLPNFADFPLNAASLPAQRNPVFNQLIPQIVKEINAPCVRFIDGRELLVDASGLTTDLLHPSDHGHIAIGEKLALLTAPQLGKITSRANP